MSSSLSTLLAGIVLLVVLSVIFIRYRRDKAHLVELRRSADEEFRRCFVGADDPRFSFSGNEAAIQRQEEVGGVRGVLEAQADFSVTIYAKNPYGEVFMFKWFSKSEKPFVKHLPNFT